MTPIAQIPPRSVAASPSPAPTSGAAQSVTQILFDYLEPGHVPVIRIVLIHRPQFSFLKESEHVYKVVISNAALKESYLELEQFPPQDFRGFNVVLPKTRGQDTIIAIGVSKGTALRSFTKDSEILIRAEETVAPATPTAPPLKKAK